MNYRLKGFTLIELLAVIAIIGILATFAAVSISGAVKRARDSLRERDLTNVKQALELYNQDEGRYPDQGDSSLPDLLEENGYIQAVPKDPKAGPNQPDYSYYSDGEDYVLVAEFEY